MTLRRRTLLQAGAAASLGGFAAVSVAQTRTKLRVGYLHTPAVDGQIWLGQQSGAWTRRVCLWLIACCAMKTTSRM